MVLDTQPAGIELSQGQAKTIIRTSLFKRTRDKQLNLLIFCNTTLVLDKL